MNAADSSSIKRRHWYSAAQTGIQKPKADKYCKESKTEGSRAILSTQNAYAKAQQYRSSMTNDTDEWRCCSIQFESMNVVSLVLFLAHVPKRSFANMR